MSFGFRICKVKFAATAFDGYGARYNGGRWNSPGSAVVYLAATPASAMMEMLVHADTMLLSLSYVLIRAEFADDLVEELPNPLDKNWRVNLAITQEIGDDFVARSFKPLLRVPSALVTREFNYVVNPAHAEFRQIVIGNAEPLMIDDRLKRLFSK
ncbi:MAG TPA: RES family NAD+ phosphorylase [Tepidisphaeraceae bacterium]